MSIFHCQAKAISRAAGRSATAVAAYRAGERIADERTGEVFDFRKKKGIVHKQIFVPRGLLGISREKLWNMAEAAEKRKDAKVAREWEIALPAELNARERKDVAQDFALAIVEWYDVAVDVCIHAPGKKGDDRNHHAHILTTTRVLTPNGFGEKTRVLDSPRTSGKEVTAIRELWERICNMALARNGVQERIDHRSLKVQGIDREPTRHLGPAAAAMERRGVNSMRGDDHRRKVENRASRELTALQKFETGIEAARRRHESRKDLLADTLKAGALETLGSLTNYADTPESLGAMRVLLDGYLNENLGYGLESIDSGHIFGDKTRNPRTWNEDIDPALDQLLRSNYTLGDLLLKFSSGYVRDDTTIVEEKSEFADDEAEKSELTIPMIAIDESTASSGVIAHEPVPPTENQKAVLDMWRQFSQMALKTGGTLDKTIADMLLNKGNYSDESGLRNSEMIDIHR